MPMTRVPFNGQLNSNEIFSSIYNMIISQDFYGDRLSALDSSLVSKFKVDGTQYGDAKLYYASDVFKTTPWNAYSEAGNLLNTNKPADPKCQAIVIDQYRMVDITLDNYLSKKAWSDEGAFNNFHSVVMSYIGKTKALYETLLINTYVGTVQGASTAETAGIDVTLSGITETGEEKNRLRAQKIAQALANLFDDLKTPSRDYNDYGYMDAYNVSDFYIIFNNKYANEITKLDTPTIFHDNLLKISETLNAKFFGTVKTTTVTAENNTVANKYRSLVEKDYTVSGSTVHVFPGDAVPTGVEIAANTAYEVKSDVICKIIHKDAIKFMGAFETATEFFNPRSLTSNHYLIWGYSQPDYLRHLPVLTVWED